MKFKYAIHILVDNFTVTYKQLLYRLTIFVVAALIGVGVLTPFIRDFINSEALNSLLTNVKTFILDLLAGNVMALEPVSKQIVEAYEQFMQLVHTRVAEIVITALLLFTLLIVEKWFTGLGNYTTAVIINNKMSLRTSSPFIGTLISHFKEAALFNLVYVPISVLFDVVVGGTLFALLFLIQKGMTFFVLNVFIFALVMVVAIAVKMTFTCDWLPALIRGKMSLKQSMIYAFRQKGKQTFNVFSNFVVILIMAIAVNVATLLFTFGAGLLLSLPASYVIIINFEMVNYYEREDLRYFLDKNTIIKPEKEFVQTREQFFKGSDYNEG